MSPKSLDSFEDTAINSSNAMPVMGTSVIPIGEFSRQAIQIEISTHGIHVLDGTVNEMLAKHRLSQKTLHSSRMGLDNNHHGASEEVPWCRATLKDRKHCGNFSIEAMRSCEHLHGNE